MILDTLPLCIYYLFTSLYLKRLAVDSFLRHNNNPEIISLNNRKPNRKEARGMMSSGRKDKRIENTDEGRKLQWDKVCNIAGLLQYPLQKELMKGSARSDSGTRRKLVSFFENMYIRRLDPGERKIDEDVDDEMWERELEAYLQRLGCPPSFRGCAEDQLWFIATEALAFACEDRQAGGGTGTGTGTEAERKDALRFLFVEDLKQLQLNINEVLSTAQTYSANPRLDFSRGKVGR